jgi:hypothetical protein
MRLFLWIFCYRLWIFGPIANSPMAFCRVNVRPSDISGHLEIFFRGHFSHGFLPHWHFTRGHLARRTVHLMSFSYKEFYSMDTFLCKKLTVLNLSRCLLSPKLSNQPQKHKLYLYITQIRVSKIFNPISGDYRRGTLFLPLSSLKGHLHEKFVLWFFLYLHQNTSLNPLIHTLNPFRI